jgi:serine/threonine-protein kinase
MISRIGKYTVEAELGRGGFGQVYKAWDPDVRQSVAIKVLLAEGDSDLLKRFQLEVVTTASLHHKNIVTIHASGEEEGTPYLVMELLEGQTLGQIVKERMPLSLLDKVRIMTQVAEGLAYAHSKGVVHRDVKPANIMLLRDGSVKIMDFGIALASNRRTVSMTMDGFVLGTVPYMAPEQFTSDAKANEQTDIFAFGDVYYELLTGHHPFEPFLRDLNALRVAVLTHDPPAVSRLAPDCPEALELLVHRCIAKERDFRYQKFEELRLDSTSVLVDLQHEQAAAILREVPGLMITAGLQNARAKVREAQRLEPGNREARQLLETIDQKLQETINRERISARLAEADKHLSEHRFAEAVQALETAAKVDKADTAVRKRLADAKAKLDGAVQANRLVEEARSKQAHGELEDAVERLDRAIQADPEHTEARRLLPKISEQLARRERDQIRQKALRAASDHLARKQFPEASAALDELEKQDPGMPAIADLRREIERQKAEEERRVRAERFNLAVARTRETMQAGDLDRAGQMLVHLTANFAFEAAGAGPVSLLREQLNALLRGRDIADCRQRANDLMNRKSYREASALLAETLSRYPDESGLVRQKASADALEGAQRRAEAVAAVLERANSLRGAGDLRGALAAIAAGRGRFGEETALVDLALQLGIEVERQRYAAGLKHLIESVRALMAAGKHEEAVDRITQAKDYAGEAEVVALLVTARSTLALKQEQQAVAQALADASSLGTQRDGSGAIRVLEDARPRYPHNSDLSQALDRFRGEMERGQRRESIERYRTAILGEIEAGLWKQADKTVRQARAEFPDEGAFLELAERIEGGLREQAIEQAVSRVRAKLTADSLPEAMRQLDETQALFAGDRRWQDLQQEIARWREYEAGLEEARRLLSQGNVTQAEALLTGMVTNAPDLRASQMMVAIQTRRAECAAVAEHVRRSLERNDTAQAAAYLNAARARYPGDRMWATLQAEIDACREALDRRARIAAAETAVRAPLERGDLSTARLELEKARSEYPGEEVWTRLQQKIEALHAEVEAARERQRRSEAIGAVIAHAQALLNAERIDDAIGALRAATARFPGEAELAGLLLTCESRLRQREIQEIRSRAEALLAQGKPQEAADLMEPRYAAEPLVAELLGRVHRELDRQRCRAQLLSLEQQAQPGLGKRQWRDLDRAARNAAAPYTGDPEIATIAARIHARVETAIAAPSPPRTIPWNLIVAGAAAAVVVGGVALAPRLWHKSITVPTTVPIEIRTDPPGATVRLGEHSCVTPSCRLDLAPGSYELTAGLSGYVQQRQTVTVNASTRLMELTLQPLPPPPPPPNKPTAPTGTLVVQTGVAGALVYVDGVASSRTDASGSVALPLEAKTHEVGVERDRYEKAAPLQVSILAGSRQTVAFRLRLQRSKLELDGAPAGVEVRIGDAPLGRTDGSAAFVFPGPVAPGDRALDVTLGAAKRAVPEHFEPGQTTRLEWKNIAPAAPPPPPPPTPTPAEVERQDWDRLGTNPGIPQLQDFLQRHPGGPHASPARSRIADLAWEAVDKTNSEALRRFLRDYPDNPHRSDGQRIVDQLEASARQQQVKAEPGKQQPARQELPKPDPVRNAGPQEQLQRQQILDLLGRLDSALQHNRPREVKAIWPGVTSMFLESLATPRTRMALTPPKAQDIRFAPQAGQATVSCVLVVTGGGLIKGHTASVTLRNNGAGWVVEALNVD